MRSSFLSEPNYIPSYKTDSQAFVSLSSALAENLGSVTCTDDSQLPGTSAPGDPTPSSDLLGTGTQACGTHIHAGIRGAHKAMPLTDRVLVIDSSWVRRGHFLLVWGPWWLVTSLDEIMK